MVLRGFYLRVALQKPAFEAAERIDEIAIVLAGLQASPEGCLGLAFDPLGLFGGGVIVEDETLFGLTLAAGAFGELIGHDHQRLTRTANTSRCQPCPERWPPRRRPRS